MLVWIQESCALIEVGAVAKVAVNGTETLMKFEVNRYLVDFVQSNLNQVMDGIVSNTKSVH